MQGTRKNFKESYRRAYKNTKMKNSETTKKYRLVYWILTAISWILVFGPLAAYLIYAMIISGTVQKAGLVTSLFTAIILTGISIILKLHIRSALFIMILGIYLAIREISVLLVIISICTVLDELVITPLQKSFKNRLTINKEIDKRN